VKEDSADVERELEAGNRIELPPLKYEILQATVSSEKCRRYVVVMTCRQHH